MLKTSLCVSSAALALVLAAVMPARAQTTAEAEKPVATEQAPEAAPAVVEPPVAEVDPMLALVRQKLAEPPRGAVDRGDRAALAAFYAERTGALLWVTKDGFASRAQSTISEIAKADDWGLSARDFELPQLGSSEAAPAALADAEIKLGLAVLKYARYARGGRLDPRQISRYIDQGPTLLEPKIVLEAVAASDAPGSYLQSLHPKHPQFQRLRQALLKARAGTGRPEAGTEPQVRLPDGPLLKPGMDHPHVALLRQRFKVAAEAGRETFYDPALQQAVAAFQRENKMNPDGLIGRTTRSVLNGEGKPALAGSEVQRLTLNMERWRWMPESLGQLHVWDNIPEFTTRVLKGGQLVHSAKIIVGKPETQTVLFSANMRYVIFHPEWGVPDSIKVKEILPYLRPSSGGGFFSFFGGADTRVLEKHNLKVSFNGRPVDASQVDWNQVDIKRYTFIQPAGAANVLGVVKFRFPNKHDIYMHDTPQRDLFDKQVRTFSHGCIRVHNPGRLAEILLEEDKGWSAAYVRGLLAQGYNNEVTLDKQVPVHVTYFTAVAGEDGTVQHFGDVYGHDNRLTAALAGRPLPLEPNAAGNPEDGQREAKRPQKAYKQTSNDLFGGIFGN
ncbi:MAG TPA: L,D-transpeptidase family protein [Hyphomicrobiaceae bacterium]|nr:L,D-transpeptidase family protein [Hyphomicrobiaceae bacterium]